MAPAAYGALASVSGSSSQPHSALRARIPAGLAASTNPDVTHASALALFRAAARATSPASFAADVAAYNRRLEEEEVQQQQQKQQQQQVKRIKVGGSEGTASTTTVEEVVGYPITRVQIREIVLNASPGEWITSVGALPLCASATPDVAALFLRTCAILCGIDTRAHWKEDPVLTTHILGLTPQAAAADDDENAPRLDVLGMSMGDLRLGTCGESRRLISRRGSLATSGDLNHPFRGAGEEEEEEGEVEEEGKEEEGERVVEGGRGGVGEKRKVKKKKFKQEY